MDGFQKHIDIVLVRTNCSANVGAAARIMKNMGFFNLILVEPRISSLTEAMNVSSGARDLIEKAKVYEKLEDGVGDVSTIIGTTRRHRNIEKEVIFSGSIINRLVTFLNNSRVAILFGPENTGLTNEELRICQFFLTIPTEKSFESMNLAQAVSIICYELYKLKVSEYPNKERDKRELVAVNQKSLLYTRLKLLLEKIDFLSTHNAGRSMASVTDIFDRAGLDLKDFNILMGILKQIELNLSKE